MSDRELDAEMKAKALVFTGAVLVGFYSLFGMSTSSYFAVIGDMGAGKSTLINALANDKNLCKVGATGNSVTQEIESKNFVRNGLHFNAIDTCGLDEPDDREKKLKTNKLKGLLAKYPKIKKIVIVKNFKNDRLNDSSINNLLTYMELFPIKDFWKHVIVVNTHADITSPGFKIQKKNDYQPFINKIKDNEILMTYIKRHKIPEPESITEYFVESYYYLELSDEFKEVRNVLDTILKDISNSTPMYDRVEVGPEKIRLKPNEEEKDLVKSTVYRIITLYDKQDDGKVEKYEIEEIIREEEKSPVSPIKTEKFEEVVEVKGVEWYDIITFGLARLFRETKCIQEYKINTYKINDKIVKGDKIVTKKYWK
jgi:GTPase SAR1 family protein